MERSACRGKKDNMTSLDVSDVSVPQLSHQCLFIDESYGAGVPGTLEGRRVPRDLNLQDGSAPLPGLSRA